MLRRFLKGGDSNSLLSAERLMVLVVAGLFAVLLISQYSHIRQRNHDQARKADLYNLQLAVQRHYALNGYYPSSLADTPGVLPQYCQDPVAGGDCTSPAYGYIAFSSDTKPAFGKTSDCNNKKVFCMGYVLFSNHMEGLTNPFVISSN